MSEKAKKVINVIVNVIITLIIILILIMAINIISSKGKGYTSIFGKAFLVVQTDSMKGDKEDNFESGDLIVIDILSEEEQQSLQVGDVITFYDYNITGTGEAVLNSHRIIEVQGSGSSTAYITQGDNVEITDKYSVTYNNVIGMYSANWGKIGKVVDWMSSSTGYFVCIVLPSFLLVAYFAVRLAIVIRESHKEKIMENGEIAEMTPEELEAYKQKMKEEAKAELLAEMQKEQENNKDENNTPKSD